MSLLDKTTYLSKSGLALLLVPFFFACDDPSELGLELEIDDNTLVTEKVEFLLPTSTVSIDSLRTDQFQNCIFGQYEDSIHGKVRAISYNNYSIDAGTLPNADSMEFVSAVIRLKVSGLRAPGVLTGEQMTIHQTNDTLYSEAVYLSNRSLSYQAESIADYTFDYDPNRDSVLQIPLADAFGQFLYTRLERAGSAGVYRDSLLNGWYYFPPLAMIPGADNEGILSFDLNNDTTGIYINMKSNSGRDYTFLFDFRAAHFNEIIRDKSSGKLSDLDEQYKESQLDGSRSYLDMVSGHYPKLDLQPYLDFVEANERIIINRSILSTAIVENQSFTYINPINLIQFYFIQPNNRIDGADVQVGNSFGSAILTENSYNSSSSSSVMSVRYDEEVPGYLSNLTLFTQILSDNFRNNGDYLAEELVMLSPQTIELGQSTFPKSAIKLTVFYTKLNSDN